MLPDLEYITAVPKNIPALHLISAPYKNNSAKNVIKDNII
jgi:hypothetical protein